MSLSASVAPANSAKQPKTKEAPRNANPTRRTVLKIEGRGVLEVRWSTLQKKGEDQSGHLATRYLRANVRITYSHTLLDRVISKLQTKK